MLEKSDLRRELTARRAIAFEAVPDAGQRLVQHFPRDLVIDPSSVIAAYMPFRTEIDPLPLMQALLGRGGQGCLPRMSAPNTTLGQFATPLPPSGEGVGGWGDSGFELAARAQHLARPPIPTPPHFLGNRGEGLLYRARVPDEVHDLRKRANRLRAEPTKYEQKLWDILRAKRPNQTHWRRQVVIGGYVFDFGCHSLRLLVEVDGGIHKLPEVQARDRLKEQVASQNGYRLIRLQNEDVLKIETAQFFDQYARSKSPSPLWEGVGVGGGWAGSKSSDLPHGSSPPTPTPPHFMGNGGEGLLDRASLSFHFADLDNPTHFQTNKWGLLEPREDLPRVTPTILLVPLLGFDRQGNRIGYGKGYYDDTIMALRKWDRLTTIGLAFAAQEVPEIPTQSHDQRLDWIITENEAYRVPS